jgi:hypothetical protein
VVHREGLRLTSARGKRAEHDAHRAAEWRMTTARAGRHAREGRRGLAYKRAGRSVGVGRNVPGHQTV